MLRVSANFRMSSEYSWCSFLKRSTGISEKVKMKKIVGLDWIEMNKKSIRVHDTHASFIQCIMSRSFSSLITLNRSWNPIPVLHLKNYFIYFIYRFLLPVLHLKNYELDTCILPILYTSVHLVSLYVLWTIMKTMNCLPQLDAWTCLYMLNN